MPNPRPPTRDSSPLELNNFNFWLHQQPWYQAYMRPKGFGAGAIHLSDAERQELQSVAAQHGIDLTNTDGMNFDPTGNLNTPHGFASQPTWAKGLEIAAPVAAATVLTGGANLPFLGGAPSTAPDLTGLVGTGLAGTTGASAATAATAGAGALMKTASRGSGIANWLSPLLQGAIPAAGQLIGAKIQSTGIKEAAEIQAKSTANALDFEKARYGDLVGRLTPYIASGATSTDRMSQLLGLPPRSATTATPMPTTPVPSSSPSIVTPSGPTQGGAGAGSTPVLMRAPDGSVRPVPPELVAKFQGLGATMVNG